jgi:hypothetical protein
VEFLLFLPFNKKKKKRGHSCPHLLLLFLYFTCFSVNITINKHLHKHASRFRHRRSNLFSSIAPPLDVPGVPCAGVLSSTRHSWSTLCQCPSIQRTFLEYLVPASFLQGILLQQNMQKERESWAMKEFVRKKKKKFLTLW